MIKKLVVAIFFVVFALCFTTLVQAQINYSVSSQAPSLQPVGLGSLATFECNITNNEDVLSLVYLYVHYDVSQVSFNTSTQQTPVCNAGVCFYNFTSSPLETDDSLLVNITFLTLADQQTADFTFQVIGYNQTAVEQNNTAQLLIGDSYEYDSVVQNATSKVANGSLSSHSHFPTTDVDWFSFEAQQGAQYRLETLTTDFYVDTLLQVIDTDGVSVLDSSDDVLSSTFLRSKLYWTSPTTDTYYVKISDGGSDTAGTYSFFIQELSNISILIHNITNATPEKNSFFTVTANVSCGGVGCTNLSIYLDPQPFSEQNKVDAKEAFKINSLDDLEENELYSVVVRLQDVDGSNILDSTSKNSQKSLHHKEIIQQAQSAVASQLPQEKFRLFSSTPQSEVVREYDSLPSISLEVTKDVLEDLQSNPYVDSFFLDVPLQIQLDTNVPFINADDVWAESFNDQTLQGQGQTVCIVDTGVDYTHNDFGGHASFPNEKIIGGWDFVNNDADPLDDQGHGTHIAGIIASQDSTYTGVAPQAKIVAIKACSAAGECSTTNVLSGIDWCIAHAEEYNISVISLSLGSGTTHWQTYCSGILPDAINYAKDQGFFVAVASGNDGWSDGISYPACASGAFAVGTIQSDDQTLRYNRGNLTNILAPGYQITSTALGGGHEVRSGTSMSTPFVAGAAALLNQYYFLRQGTQLHVNTIAQALEENSPLRVDFSTAQSYPRLDILSVYTNSVLPKGIISTTVGAIPFYTNSSNPQNVTVGVNNWTLVSWDVNATGDLGYYDFFAFTSRDGEYFEVNSTIESVQIVDTTAPELNFTFENASWVNSSTPSFSFTVADLVDEQTNCSLFINDSLQNSSLFSSGQQEFFVFVDDGDYTAYIVCQDNSSNSNTSQTKTFFVDTVQPQINFSSYGANYSLVNQEINFTFIVTDDRQLQTPPFLEINNQTIALVNDSNATYFSTNFTPNLVTTYSWTAWVVDAAQNNQTVAGGLVVGDQNQSINILFSNESTQLLNYSLFSTQVDVRVNTSLTANFTVIYFEDEPSYVQESLENALYFVRYDAQDILEDVINWTRIELRYTTDQIQGLDESTLGMYRYNETNSSWTLLTQDSLDVFSLGQDTSQKFLWVNTSHYSTYSLSGEQILCINDEAVPATGCFYNDVLYLSGYICSGSFSSTVCDIGGSTSSPSSSSPSSSSPSGGSSGGFAMTVPVVTQNTTLQNQTLNNTQTNATTILDIEVKPLEVEHIIVSQETTLLPSEQFVCFCEDELPFVVFTITLFYLGFSILYRHKNLHRRM